MDGPQGHPDSLDPSLSDFSPVERDSAAPNRNPSLRRKPRLREQWVRDRVIPDCDVLQGIRERMAQLYESGRIRVVDGRECFAPGARDEMERLFQERHCIWKRLGSTRIHGGFDFQIKLNGVAYRFSPYMAWEMEFLKAFEAALPTPYGPHVARDRLLWLIWHFRHRAVIQVGKTPNKVRGPLGECTSCGYPHRVVPGGQHGCPRCHGVQYRDVSGQASLRPFGRVTKAGLRRRFKVSRYGLDCILAIAFA
jgi:hypothetical protein